MTQRTPPSKFFTALCRASSALFGKPRKGRKTLAQGVSPGTYAAETTSAVGAAQFPTEKKPSRGGTGKACLFFFLTILPLCGAILYADSRASFLPKLQRGQTLLYDVHGRLDRKVKTESRFASIRGPQELQGDLSDQLRITIQEVRPGKGESWVSAQTELLPGEGARNPRFTSAAPKVSFDIVNAGQLGRLTGLEDLPPEQRVLWEFWAARFAFAWTLPHKTLKPGETWKMEEPELSDSLIANLVWEREVTYARDDKCPVFPSETCSVFLVQSTLKQKSSTKDSTPDDYRLHGLKTFGTAKGENQVITYISRRTGLVLRANEDLRQNMDVTVMNTDGTNGVHYTIDANSHLETLFVPQVSPPGR